MKTHTLGRLFSLGLAALLPAPVLRAAVTNLAANADTFIHDAFPDFNAGANEWFDAGTDGVGGNRRGLVRFDLSVIPPGSTVTSAQLQLTVIRVPGSATVDSTFDVFRLTTGWNEAAQPGMGGDIAAIGEATWNARENGLLNWTAPGATNDTLIAASASAAVNSTFNATYSWSSTALTADVQFWVNNPGFNFGWLLKSRAEGTLRSVRGFAARENGSSIGSLQVGYIPPPAPGPAANTSFALSDKTLPIPPLTIPHGLATFGWLGDTNGAFDLLYSDSVGSSATWKLAQANIVGAASGNNVFSDPPHFASPAYAPNAQLFYRLRSLPPPAPPLGVRLPLVASGLVSPTVLTHAGDGSGRLFIADQTGQIRIVDNAGTRLPAPFLDVASKMVTLNANYDERGLLGLAFHPGYSSNGLLYVYYSAPPSGGGFNSLTVLSEYKVSAADTNLADTASERILLTVPQPESNHKGAAVVFGPDGYLYLGLGDGGGADDQHGVLGNGQVLTNLLGKILRVDVNGNNSANGQYGIPADNPFVATPGARPEIYAYGFRNPWRFSFDRGGTHQGFIGDVGQNLWEEVDILASGANYGWRILEGNHAHDPALATTLGVNLTSLAPPIFEYIHGLIGIAIIGGFIYRGPSYPDLVGKYVFGDFSTSFGSPAGKLYYLAETRPGIWERFEFQLWPGGGSFGRFVKGFGEDAAGEIYVLSSTKGGPSGATGDVRRMVRP